MALRYLNLLLMRNAVKDLLGEQTRDSLGSPVAVESSYWSDSELDRYINDSYIEAARLTKALEFIEVVATTADQASYTLSANMGQIFRVSYDDRKIFNITKFELDRREPDWENESGYVSHYVTSSMSSKVIRLYKAPTVSGGLVTSGGEYGIITDIDDGGTNTYTFASEYGVTIETAGTGWESDFSSEYGTVTITGGVENNFEVWATKIPDRMTSDLDINEFPNWAHMGIAFRSAAKALRKYGEQGNADKAAAYDLVAQDYMALLNGILAQRSANQVLVLGGVARNQQRVPQPWDQTVEG